MKEPVLNLQLRKPDADLIRMINIVVMHCKKSNVLA